MSNGGPPAFCQGCKDSLERIATLEARVKELKGKVTEYKKREPELVSAEEVCHRLRKLKDGYVPIEELVKLQGELAEAIEVIKQQPRGLVVQQFLMKHYKLHATKES